VSAQKSLTTALQRQVLSLEDDLRARVESDPDVLQDWTRIHDEALRRRRTSATWQAWRDDRVTQAAVAWVLTTVFVRFCEDNALVSPVWITGQGARRQEALDAELAFYRVESQAGRDVTSREWLWQAVQHFASLPATRALVDEHSALHLVQPSGDAAGALLAFWRERGDDGELIHDLTDPDWDTRFLGDLYQDLSEHAKSTYALLQTPDFVEEFILDQTLTPALAERPLEGLKLIDPTCGSGHFLLGAFERLLDQWQRHAPGLDSQALVQEALDAIHGVDLNPFAVAIARFRLTVAALRGAGLPSLEDAPRFNFHLASGDSLLHGTGQQTLQEDADLSEFGYATEDTATLGTVLQGGQYDVVVGNPPYITVKDPELNAAYRQRYQTCKGKYAMTAPFMERFFGLAKRELGGVPAGWVGQITSNAFMKREFGSRLVEDFLPLQDLVLVADTSGAYIPGHGTPTVIVIGRHRRPAAGSVRAVLGVRGEPGRPENASTGLVWTSIRQNVDNPGYEDQWITVVDMPRLALSKHPWSLSGGGAAGLLAQAEAAKVRTLGESVKRIGVFGIMGSDDSMMVSRGVLSRRALEADGARSLVVGDQVRDHAIADAQPAWFPYDDRHGLLPISTFPGWARHMWRNRTELGNRATFTKGTYFSDGRPWWEWHQLPKDVGASPLTITFAFVSTHNHFVLDRGGKVFKQSAPVIKLPAGASEDEHLALLGVLNSSTACFWLKQNSHNKGEGGGARVDAGYAARGEPFRETYEFTGTTLQDFPLPAELPLQDAQMLDDLATQSSVVAPRNVVQKGVPSRVVLASARLAEHSIRGQMVLRQEEMDWRVYRSYGLLVDDLTYDGTDAPELAFGERAFEIALARRIEAGHEESTWFTKHGSRGIIEIPPHWPAGYRDVVQRRLDLIEVDPAVRLLERPEHKRRWAEEPWEKRENAALRDWLLERLENSSFWINRQGQPTPRSVAQLADEVARDADLTSVLALWEGRPDVPVTQSLLTLLADEVVPFLAAYRLKDSGLRKYEDWQQTWADQRREDAGEQLGRSIPVPPKYTSADFRKTSYWQARGKLDVSKERFILYPAAGRDTDPTPLLGWAGWDHAQQSLALSVVLSARESEGWADERLVPLVAGLAELQPWVDQWHADVDPTYGVSLASFTSEELTRWSTQVGLTREQLAAWRPAAATRGRKPRSNSA
jgi:hypothetical protein